VPDVRVKIVADTGEVRSGLPAALEDIGATVQITALRVADYVVASGIGVERKTVADLHRSIAIGRLWGQLLACRQTLDRTYLLVEGDDLDRGCLSVGGVRGALLEIGDRGVTVLRSTSVSDSAAWLLRVAVRIQRSRGPGTPSIRRFRHATTPQSLLAEIPGIGPSTAAALLDRFGSVRGVANADPLELGEVPGIGPQRAAMLSRVLIDGI
jgi:DNA excision repair protein ERCC-4